MELLQNQVSVFPSACQEGVSAHSPSWLTLSRMVTPFPLNSFNVDLGVLELRLSPTAWFPLLFSRAFTSALASILPGWPAFPFF